MIDETEQIPPSDDSPTGDLRTSGPGATTDTSILMQAGKLVAGRYKLLKPIGEGGMGAVWVAEQSEPVKRRVAIKLIKPGMDSHQVVARFDAERQALAVMDHPNVAKVFDGGLTDEDRPFFVMEYFKGVPITEYCDHARLSVKDRLELFKSVCGAVQHAHQKGIIHRDLKPSNILVGSEDGEPSVKVIDFGLAKATAQSLTEQTLFTAHGMVLGTPLYMSPEQAESSVDIDTRTDIYSLGVILYELLTGSTPLERQQLKRAGAAEFARLIRDVDPPRPSSRISSSDTLPSVAAQRSVDPSHLRRKLSGDLDWVVMKALEKERNRRYETANGLAADIQRHLDDEPVTAGPPSVRYRMEKFLRRNRVAVTAGSLVIVAMVVAIVGTSFGMIKANRALREKDQALSETRRTIDDYVETVENAELLKEERFKPLLKDLLAGAVAHYERFIDQHDHGQDQLLGLAKALNRVSRISTLSGDIEKAIESSEKAIEIREQLVNHDPKATDYRDALATDYRNAGRLYGETGRMDQALVCYQKARGILEQMLADDPSNLHAEFSLASTRLSLGKLYRSTDQPQKAIEVQRDVIENLDAIVDKSPGVSDYCVELALGHFELGVTYLLHGEPQLALTSFEKGLGLQTALVEQKPNSGEYQHLVVSSYTNIGRAHESMGQIDEAREAYTKAVAMAERLDEENPTVTRFKNGLSTAYHNLGLFYQFTREFDQALAVFDSQAQLLDRLVEENPTVLVYQDGLAKHHHQAGHLLQMMGNPAQALESYNLSLAIRKRLAGENPSSINYQKSLAEGHINIGHTHFSVGQPAKALESFKRALEIQTKIVDEHPSVAAYQKNLGMILNNVGLACQNTGRLSEAFKAYEQSQEILEKSIEVTPKSVEVAVLLGGVYINTANLNQIQKEFDTSLENYQQAFATLQKVLADNPDNPEARNFMRQGHMGRALLRQGQGRYDLAVLDWDVAIEMDDGSMKASLELTRNLAAEKAQEQKAGK